MIIIAAINLLQLNCNRPVTLHHRVVSYNQHNRFRVGISLDKGADLNRAIYEAARLENFCTCDVINIVDE